MIYFYRAFILAIVCFFQVNASDAKLAFIDASFDDFVGRMLSNIDDRALFKAYFANLMQKLQDAHEKEPEKEKATYRYLNALALKKLEEKHAAWHQEIYPFVADVRFTLDSQFDDTRRIIKFFLTRYGAYEEFLNFKATQPLPGNEQSGPEGNNQGFWNKIKGYVVATKDTIVSWFESGQAATQTI